MAKTNKGFSYTSYKDGATIKITGCLIVGSSDDASLSKTVCKDFTLSAPDQTDADSLSASLEAEMESDEGIV